MLHGRNVKSTMGAQQNRGNIGDLYPDISPKRKPRILVPYVGPSDDENVQDIFLYMRPETNGILGESAIVRVIENLPHYHSAIKLIYMANLPGEFMCHEKIIEHHYSVKIYFAKKGKEVFTPYMRQAFACFFGCVFDDAPIIGSFEALDVFSITPDELFSTWVDNESVCIIDGQNVKLINGYYVVNYDAPALLQKHREGTDIAVMLFRLNAPYTYSSFREMVSVINVELKKKKILAEGDHVSRAFHYSKSPFEQVLDSIDYLYIDDHTRVDIQELSFVQFLLKRGVTLEEIVGMIEHPIAQFCINNQGDEIIENAIIAHTNHDSYQEAFEKLHAMTMQYMFLSYGYDKN